MNGVRVQASYYNTGTPEYKHRDTYSIGITVSLLQSRRLHIQSFDYSLHRCLVPMESVSLRSYSEHPNMNVETQIPLELHRCHSHITHHMSMSCYLQC